VIYLISHKKIALINKIFKSIYLIRMAHCTIDVKQNKIECLIYDTQMYLNFSCLLFSICYFS